MERGRIITWYLYLKDIHTQAEVARKLDAHVDFAMERLCADGVKRDLWKTDYALVSYLQESVRKKEPLFFLVFRQVENGPIRLWKGFPEEWYQKEVWAFVRRARAIKQRVKAA
ncbi:MAG: hypothetical protein Q8P88_01900 [Candidatus Jorgensenbacteria bacterium]|nr:hypothetical protein [Candidatus Jorgensenbacteria bacterium]